MDNNDPFADIMNSGSASQSAIQQQPVAENDPFADIMAAPKEEFHPPENNWLADKLDIFNKSAEKYALGGMQLLSGGVRNTLGQLPVVGDSISAGTNMFDQAIINRNKARAQEYNDAYARTPSPFTSFAGDIVGGGIAAAPGTMLGGGPIIQGIGAGLTSAASDYSDTGAERLKKMAIGGTIGGAIPMAYAGFKSAFKSILEAPGISSSITKMFNPEKAAVQDYANALVLDSGNNVNDALGALSKIKATGGVNGATIAESLGNNAKGKLRQLEGSIKLPDELQGDVAKHLSEAQVLKGQLLNQLDSMKAPEIIKAKEQAFGAMKGQFLTKDGKISTTPSADVPDVVANNPVLQSFYDKIKTSDLKQWQDMPDNSLEKLHVIKSQIGKELNNAKPNKMGQTAVPLDNEKLLLLKQSQKELDSVLKQSPEYNVAMEAAASEIRGKNYSNLVNSITPTAGNKEVTLEQMAKELIPNPMKKQKFAQDVIDAGGDPEQITTLLNKVDALKDSPMWDALRGGKYGGNLAPGDSNLGAIQKTIQNMTMKNYYAALSKVTLSGDKWVDDITNVLSQKTDLGTLTGWFNLLKKAGGKVEKTLRPSVKAAFGVNMGELLVPPERSGPYGTTLRK